MHQGVLWTLLMTKTLTQTMVIIPSVLLFIFQDIQDQYGISATKKMCQFLLSTRNVIFTAAQHHSYPWDYHMLHCWRMFHRTLSYQVTHYIANSTIPYNQQHIINAHIVIHIIQYNQEHCTNASHWPKHWALQKVQIHPCTSLDVDLSPWAHTVP